MIAALFVATGGCYFGLPDVDPWDVHRDARLYTGPYAVVAHPPCERWGRYARGGPSARVPRLVGDDGGCFKAALRAVRDYGGVLEHPEASLAWDHFGLPRPARTGYWTRCPGGAWTCCVEQGHYGHRARKATWLYAVVTDPPELIWGPARGERLDEGFHSAQERRAARAAGQAPRGQSGGASAARPAQLRREHRHAYSVSGLADFHCEERTMTTRRGTSNTNVRGNSRDREARRRYLVCVYEADKGPGYCRCYRCSRVLTMRTVTVDRIVPGAKGGRYVRSNIRLACARCNSETGATVRG